MASPTAVNPPTFTMSVAETQTVGLDATAYLSTGQSVSSVSSSLTRLSDGQVVSLSDSPTLSGNVVSQILRGPTELDAGSVYLLRVTFVATPSVNKWAMDLEVTVTP